MMNLIENELNPNWIESREEGQLSVDVYETEDAIVVKSTIAGVEPEDLDISVNHDMLTIRGHRENKHVVKDDEYIFRECYWGSFSRSLILPIEVDEKKIDAIIENGVLTITLPKSAEHTKRIEVKIIE